jgi:hypothetical protein
MFTSTIFAGNDYWGSNSQHLLPLDVAKRTESVVKRGFEFSHSRSQDYSLSSFVNVGKDGVLRYRDRKFNGTNSATSASQDSRYPRNSFTTKKLARPPLVSLDEANRREKARRRKAAQEVMARKTTQERQVRQLEKQEAEKKEKAKLEQLENMILEEMKKEEYRRRQEAAALASAALTEVVPSPQDHLVVGPSNWIVPLISLNEAQKNETARRQMEAENAVIQFNVQSDAVASRDHLVVNTPDGPGRLRLVSLEEAKRRDTFRRQREVTSQVAHFPPVTLEEARKRESSRSKDSEKARIRTRESHIPPRHLPVHPNVSEGNQEFFEGERRWKIAVGAQEKERWHNLMLKTSSSRTWRSPAGVSEFVQSSAESSAYPDWL